MPFLIVMILVFVLLGMLWVIGAGLLLGTALSGVPGVLDRILNYKGKNCACHFPFKHHT
jgi:hypothetical protein